ncbi:MAG: hypothetical protein ACU83N_04370 [Gammaproteobacteria bacterium]
MVEIPRTNGLFQPATFPENKKPLKINRVLNGMVYAVFHISTAINSGKRIVAVKTENGHHFSVFLLTIKLLPYRQ